MLESELVEKELVSMDNNWYDLKRKGWIKIVLKYFQLCEKFIARDQKKIHQNVIVIAFEDYKCFPLQSPYIFQGFWKFYIGYHYFYDNKNWKHFFQYFDQFMFRIYICPDFTVLYLNYIHGAVCIFFRDIKFLVLFSCIPERIILILSSSFLYRNP